jgi:hypothetical protein
MLRRKRSAELANSIPSLFLCDTSQALVREPGGTDVGIDDHSWRGTGILRIWFVVRDVLLNLDVALVRLDYPLLPIFSIAAVLAAGAVFVRAGRRGSWEGLGLGILGWWLAATVATSLWLPGASYAFLWPLLAILAGQAVAFLVPRGGTVAVLASWLSAVPLLIIHTMILPDLFVGLNLRMTALLMVPVVLIAGALVPMAGQVVGDRARAV